MKQWRQGDLLIEEIDKLPSNIKKQKDKVLLEGEITGHKHEFMVSDDVDVYEAPDRDSGIFKYFRVKTPEKLSFLIHPDHKKIEFKKGNYQVIRQREYTPRSYRNVQD